MCTSTLRTLALFIGLSMSDLPMKGQDCCVWAQAAIDDVRNAAYPELARTKISVRPLCSPSDYMRARFSLERYFLARRMEYFILVNPRLMLLQAPPDVIRAIAAHELAHISYYRRGNRWQLLGMIRMLSAQWRSRFERTADGEAIRRGFGAGLKEYRRWLYVNIPSAKLPEKMRDYLSPEEIDAFMGTP